MCLQKLIFLGQILKTKYYIYVKMFKKNKNMDIAVLILKNVY